ncbi:MAG: glycosyltransferase family 39 protein [Candidatus Promineifilaceae bacterium]|nr:glycosyltransferase family 39 protein [Candidatus Promineifilaceae bacterium]
MSGRVPRGAGPAAPIKVAALAVTLAAFGLRVWHLDGVPPGWRDDELINALVISQKALDGSWALYYPDASGHEALFHWLTAISLGLFGPGTLGIRLVPAFLGTLTVPLTYALGRRLGGWRLGLVAAAALSLSFWSLMYSRIGLRHISLPVLVLLSFYFFWRGLGVTRAEAGATLRPWIVAGLAVGAGFYTYFAARGVPLILLAFCLYLVLARPQLLGRRWRGLVVLFVLTALMAAPLIVLLARQPEMEARVAELAAPLVEASAGDLDLLLEHVRITMSMFHSRGDSEWLYNIPDRPLFGVTGALLFWAGVGLAGWAAVRPLGRRLRGPTMPATPMEMAAAFLLLWWLAGIAPAFFSVPPASLGHTIMAQPAVYLLAAWPVAALSARLGRWSWSGSAAIVVLALTLLASIGARDLPAYFSEWPQRGLTRFLYRADIREVANYVAARPQLTDFAISGLLAGPWDRVALDVDLPDEVEAQPRWFHPERAVMLRLEGAPPLSFVGYPLGPPLRAERYEPVGADDPAAAGAYWLGRVEPETVEPSTEPICFGNGLCLLAAEYTPEIGVLELTWEVARPLALPAQPLISNPPPPGVYAGPRLLVFAHLVDGDGQLLLADDGLWVDATTLKPADRFLQQHRLPPTSAAAALHVGLYDPKSGARIPTEDGRDYVWLALDE